MPIDKRFTSTSWLSVRHSLFPFSNVNVCGYFVESSERGYVLEGYSQPERFHHQRFRRLVSLGIKGPSVSPSQHGILQS